MSNLDKEDRTMFKLTVIMTYALALCLLLAGGLLGPGSAWADHLLKPDDTIGGMTLKKFNTVDQSIPPIAAFCEVPLDADAPQPGSYAVTCTVPALPRIVVGNGWFAANQERLEENWSAMTYENYLDGHRIDEQAFGLLDGEIQTPDGAVKIRVYGVELHDLVGTHTLRHVLHLSREVNDGFVTFPAGTYEYLHTFTVSSAPAGGQAPLPETGGMPEAIIPLLAVATCLLITGGVLRRQRRIG